VNAGKLIAAAFAISAANVALAGPTVPLGVGLGDSLGLTLGDALGGPLGATLGFFLGTPVGSVLPIASVALLGVSALSLAIGIYIVKRKKHG
jgi:hypothetical protein